MSNILGNMPPVFGSGYRGVVPAPSAADVSAQNILRADGTWGAGPSGTLPSQTGNGGKLLTTDGTNASWASSLNTFQFSDVTLGTSGPSVKSSLSARAPRQGLVFDGTAGATVSVPALGTADYTFAIWINPTSLSTSEKRLLGSDGVGAFEVQIDRGTAGNIAVIKSNSSVVTTTGALLSAGKLQLVTITRTSTSGVISINGVQAATFTDSQNYTAVSDKIGSILSPASYYNGTLIGPLVYNRALSASEVVALYESGAPATATYGGGVNDAGQTVTAASSTSLVTGANSNFSSDSGYWNKLNTVTISGGNCTLASGSGIYRYNSSLVQRGKYYGFTVTISALSGTLNVGSNNGTTYLGVSSQVSTTSTGTFSGYFYSDLGNFIISVSGGGSATLTGFTIFPAGLLLAPDAAQAGGGLTWYDTSGNAANITLPASGVSWNVPSSGYWGGNLTISKSSTTTGPVLQLENTNDAIDAGGTLGRLQFYSGDDSGGGNSVRAWIDSIQTTTTPVGSALRFAVANGANAAGEVVRIAETGNLLIGTTTDTGEKLQVNGTGYFAGALLQLGNASNDAVYRVSASNGKSSDFGDDTTGGFVRANNSQSLRFITGGNIVLTLDSSANATFAGSIKFSNALGDILDSASNRVLRLYSGSLLVSTGATASTGATLQVGGDATFAGSIRQNQANNISLTSGVATTIFSLGTSAGVYIVTATLDVNAAAGYAIVGKGATGTWQVLANSGTQMSFSMSTNDLQITQSSGSTSTTNTFNLLRLR